MPSSAAERQKRYRERMKNENPNKFLEMKRRNADRTNKNRKRIADFEPEEQAELRKQWREKKMKKKEDEEKTRRGSEYLTENSEREKMNKQRFTERLNYRLKKENYDLKVNIESMKKEMFNLKKKLNRSLRKNKHLLDIIHQKNDFIQKLQLEPDPNIQEEEKHTPCSRANMFIEENLPNISLEEREKVKKRLLEHHVLVDTIKERYENSNTNCEKKVLKNIVSCDIAKKYKMKTKMRSYFGLRGKIRQIEVKKQNFSLLNHLKKFYERDDNSIATAGKKEVKTLKKETRQRRYLLGTLKQLHRKYKSEGGRISFATFKRYRPFYILSPKVNTRNTCACKRHENLQMKANQLKSMCITDTKSLDDLLLMVVCDAKKKECAYGECENCKDKAVEFKLDGKNLHDSVSWSEWTLKNHEYDDKKNDGLKKVAKKIIKEKKVDTLQKLLQSFADELNHFKTHSYNIIHQYTEYQRCIRNLDDQSIAVHIDFSENYCCKLSTEIQSMHFGASRQQFTLHTGVLYSKGRDPMSFTSISPCNNHGPEAIWAHLSPVLQLIRREFNNVHGIHFFSDGPTVQYRQKKNFYLFCKFTKELGFPFSTWNFFESAHGKGAADGIGGAVKRKLDSFVSYGSDITDAESAYRLLKETETKIRLFYVPEIHENVNTQLCPVPGTMGIHQLRNSDSENNIYYRTLSCFCDKASIPGYCQCFDIKEHNLKNIQKPKQPVEKDYDNFKSKSNYFEEPSTSLKKCKIKVNNFKNHDCMNNMDTAMIQDQSNKMLVAKDGDKNAISQRKRLRHLRRYINDDDSDASIESSVNLVESDGIVWQGDEVMEFDQLDRDEHEVATISIENSEFEHKETEKITECNPKITILSDIRFSPENRKYFDLQKYFPVRLNEVGKDFNLFSVQKNKENIINAHHEHVPSTSGCYEKQKNIVMVNVKEENNKENRETNCNINDLRNMNLDMTEIILDDGNKKVAKKSIEKQISYERDVSLSSTEQDQKIKTQENETKEPNKIREEEIERENSVLVRYFEKKSWVYYVGFVESVEIKKPENNYAVRFLKTVKKPQLKFVSTKKLDRDIVPAVCIVKKVNLNSDSNEYLLSDKSDHSYFD